jgi:hypothetical protein
VQEGGKREDKEPFVPTSQDAGPVEMCSCLLGGVLRGLSAHQGEWHGYWPYLLVSRTVLSVGPQIQLWKGLCHGCLSVSLSS